ncbi:hypothetical protein [Blastococcus mobilis]|uniref:DUF4333 domain-containing protein n=1 Tax=Blastococcus mobilis TaxID=1938746 RepID=A0A238XAF3_9ACTN|nr:hypothetical protein [Blastococcus mobilis]SNR56015.1 hypothetical protein SAMN06272737_112127 [Blastococcus mobilis]
MSSDSTNQTGSDPTRTGETTPGTTVTAQPTGGPPVPGEPVAGQPYSVQPTATGAPADDVVTAAPSEPSWVQQHKSLLVAALVAVAVVAAAIGGVAWYRGMVDDRDAATEAAFAQNIAQQGAEVETVDCNGDTCSAVIGGTAYTVLVQEDANGEQHFGVAAFVGD